MIYSMPSQRGMRELKNRVRSRTEEILEHLINYTSHYRYKWDCPFAICQQGIADMLGVVRSNVARYLLDLESEGLIESQVKHILNLPRKRKAYFITSKGREVLADMKS